MRLLITGGNGQVAVALQKLCQQQKEPPVIFAPTRATLDITDSHAMQSAVRQCRPDVVINAAAFTAVDLAEKETKQALAVNRDAAGLLAAICAQEKIPLIHLSTDYVFDGAQSAAYQEDDLTAPLNMYGKTKSEGEVLIRERHEQHVILRLSGIFSSHGHNFLKTILRLAQQQEILRIVSDQYTCPTSACDIAKAIFQIAEKIVEVPAQARWGTYHYCSHDPVSWFQFAEAVIAAAKDSLRYPLLKIQEITAIATSDYPTAAVRPARSILDCRKIQAQWGIYPRSWRDSLNEILAEDFTQ